MIESLEDRRLLSASVLHHAVHASVAHHASVTHHVKHAKSTGTTSGTSSGSGTSYSGSERGRLASTIEFSQAPAAVQTGLKGLASSDGLTAPTTTQTVFLGNSGGVETYSLHYSSSGTAARITVDPTGAAVTAPSETTITWATLSGTGAGSDAAAASEITAIASARGLAAPTSTTTVDVRTSSNGQVTYSVRLGATTTSTTNADDDVDGARGSTISVDTAGNPVGDQQLPFSVLPSAVQNGINAHLPSGATALASTSTQNVDVRTANGRTFYSATFTSAGTTSTVTVDTSGALATLPTTTTTTFADLQTSDAAAATALQTLATDKGAGTIASTDTVTAYNEGNGTTIYTVTVSATDSTTGQTMTLTIAVDQAGNPTVPPEFGGGGGGDCGGGSGFGRDGGGFFR